MSRSVKPIMGIYQDEKGSKYLKLSEDKSSDSSDEERGDVIDLEHTDNESDGENEEYLPTDEDEEEIDEEEYEEDEEDEEL